MYGLKALQLAYGFFASLLNTFLHGLPSRGCGGFLRRFENQTVALLKSRKTLFRPLRLIWRVPLNGLDARKFSEVALVLFRAGQCLPQRSLIWCLFNETL
jgi:hypothetical protein